MEKSINIAVEEIGVQTKEIVIDSNAFYGCDKLKTVLFVGDKIEMKDNSLQN